MVLLALIGFIGYTAYSNRIDKNTLTESSVAKDVPLAEEVPIVETTKDINTVENMLDDVELSDDGDFDKLNDELNGF